MGQITSACLTLNEVLDSTEDGVFVLDGERRFIAFNKACERLTGYPADEVVGVCCPCSTVSHCQDHQGQTLTGLLCPGLAVYLGSVPAQRQRVHIQCPSGESRWLETRYTTLRDGAGRTRCVIGVLRNAAHGQTGEPAGHEHFEALGVELQRLREHFRQLYGFDEIITRSPGMQAAMEKVDAARASLSPVLIVGESGSGKERMARVIHNHGSRSKGPFVPAGVRTIPRERLDAELFGSVRNGTREDGCYVSAEGGTLFLEDVDALPGATQDRLLRVLEDRAVAPVGTASPRPADVRLIAATCRPIHELLAGGMLRQDLYYRLGVITIEIPPLRARHEDIPLLVRYQLDRLNRSSVRPVKEVEPEFWEALQTHSWPGNVRELFGVVEASFAAARDGRLRAEDIQLTPRVRVGPAGPVEEVVPLDERLAEIERHTILSAIRQAGGQRNLAARLMGISRSRLYRRMEALGIDPDSAQGL